MNRNGDDLIERILKGGDDPGELLNAFFNGYPIKNLRILLGSEDQRVVKTGAWIASELGGEACGLKDDFHRLLNHSSRYVRFFALDCVLACATSDDGSLIARAICAINDIDEAVCWKALKFISMASSEQLRAGTAKLDDVDLSVLSDWLVRLQDFEEVHQELLMRLASPIALERLFGVAGAVRKRGVWPDLLEIAVQSADSAVASFASEQLKISDA